MKRITSSTVELTDIESRFAGAHEAATDLGGGHIDACVEAWEVTGDYSWLPSAEFIEWLIGPTTSMDSYVDDTLYAIHCLMQTCPDHGPVRFTDGGEMPSMAGGWDSHESWSCGCVVSTTPYSHSRRRPDGTYSDDCGGTMSAIEPARLAPLGETDCWSYANGLIVYYREGKVFFHNGYDVEPVIVPKQLGAVIYAVAFACGLSCEQAGLIREAVESYA